MHLCFSDFKKNFECGQVVMVDAGTGDLLSEEKSLIDCVNDCDLLTNCLGLQSTHDDTTENPLCDLYSTAFATIPPTASADTLYDYYCRKG